MKNKKSLKMLMLALGLTICTNSCKKEIKNNDAELQANSKSGTGFSTSAAPAGYDIMCTNNANNKLELFNYGDADWNAAGALKWSWMPTTALGYTSTEIGLWTNGDPEGDPMDAKRVTTSIWPDVSEVLVSVGGQLATIARYATSGTKGSKIWAINTGSGSYPHAAALLPNGNLAVAASHGDWVRIYNTTGTNYQSYSLPGAHGVVWDYNLDRLWVIGDTKLTALIIGGTRTAPTISEDTPRAKTIPGNGHDLSIYEGDPNKLWLTNSGSVYIYDKTTKVLTNAPGAAYRTAVKAVSNNDASTGYMIVETKPTTACTTNTWCTPNVQFYNSAGTLLGSRTRTGAAYYKADVWSNDPQPTIDDFQYGVGRFHRAPTYNCATVGIATSSTTSFYTNATTGGKHLKVNMIDDPAVTPWKVRLLSGSGLPINNVPILNTATGTISIKLFTSTAQPGATVRIWLDDSDGNEQSLSQPIINDSAWHTYTWNIQGSGWTAAPGAGSCGVLPGNGVINATQVTLDAIVLEQADTTTPWSIYVDDITKTN